MDLEISYLLLAVGRVLLGGLFVAGGVHHFFDLSPITAMMQARGVPEPQLVLLAGSVFQIVAGLLLMLGLWVAAAAFGLIVFTVAASVMLLNFWDMEGEARIGAQSAFQANMGIIGGLLIAAAQAI
jgi:putative oxidoreductase